MLTACAALTFGLIPLQAAAQKPNILVIWGDDIGRDNISAYSLGIMGTRRPTSIASRGKARSSPTRMRSRAARRAAHRSSSASIRSHGLAHYRNARIAAGHPRMGAHHR
jgi:arylsulfatase